MKFLNAAAVAVALLGSVSVVHAAMALPEFKAQATPEAVVAEHVDALNNCSWERLMAQYPDDAQINLPGDVVVVGRAALGDLFEGFCKDPADGGLKGLQFTALSSVTIGDTVVTLWQADAPFLAEPYKGSDAYVSKDGMMQAQVSTFDGAALKMK